MNGGIRLTAVPGAYRLRRLAAAVAVCLGVLFCAPVAAHAGNYTVLECMPTSSEGFPDLRSNSWDNTYIGYGQDCSGSSGNPWAPGVALYARTAAYGPIQATLWVDAPPGTYFHTASFHTFIGSVNCAFNGAAPYWGGQTVGGWHRDFGPPCSGARNEWVSTAPNATQILWNVGCYPSLNGAGWCVHEEGNWRDWNAIGGLNLEVTDYTAPSLSVGGQALAHDVIAGQVGLDVSVTDQGSGVRSAWVDVNGTRYANLPTSCPGIVSWFADRVRPCSELTQGVSINTAAAPFREGQNTVKSCAADYATVPGTTANTTCVERTLLVDNSCADSQGAQQGPASTLTARFDSPGSSPNQKSLKVYSTEGAKLSGQLRGGGGGPVAGASICLYEQIDAPAEIRQLAQVTKTRSDGGYQLQLPAGPSRDYDVVYRTNDETLEQRGLQLDSIVVPTLHVGPNTPGAATAAKRRGGGAISNGQAARFTGQLPGPYAADRVVVLQALVGRGCGKEHKRHRSSASAAKKRCKPNKWRTFKTVRTDSRGRYSGIYRFTQTRGKVRYSFRAAVPEQAGYPYRAGSSDIRQVTVRGPRR